MQRYEQCREEDIPTGIRFDVPGRNHGQIVEVAYGTFDRNEAGPGDPYKRVIDQSEPSTSPARVTFYRLIGEQP